MTALVTMDKASQQYAGFYVPQFKILVKGSPLPGEVLHDVVEITYKDKLEEIDSCELVVNNWDADHGCFKYIGSEELDETTGKPTASAKANNPNAELWNLFDPCTEKVELHLGYAPGPLTKMMVGNFVTYEPNFPSSGPPVLSVRMLNELHKLRSEKKDEHYTPSMINPLTDSRIAEYIHGKKRLPMPILVDDNAKAEEAKAPLSYVIQKSQYDIDFLWQRARRNGYDLVITDDNELAFRPSTTKDRPVYQLMWGQSLIDFKPTLTTGNQYKSVTVRGWDRAAQKPIEEKVELKDMKVNKNLAYLLDQCDQREETVVERPCHTKAEANSLAKSIFKDQLKRMVRATGTTVGLPELRAGCKVQIGGAGSKMTLGSRLSGTYFVTSTTHVFNSSGYTTRFEARREDEESGQ